MNKIDFSTRGLPTKVLNNLVRIKERYSNSTKTAVLVLEAKNPCNIDDMIIGFYRLTNKVKTRQDISTIMSKAISENAVERKTQGVFKLTQEHALDIKNLKKGRSITLRWAAIKKDVFDMLINNGSMALKEIHRNLNQKVEYVTCRVNYEKLSAQLRYWAKHPDLHGIKSAGHGRYCAKG